MASFSTLRGRADNKIQILNNTNEELKEIYSRGQALHEIADQKRFQNELEFKKQEALNEIYVAEENLRLRKKRIRESTSIEGISTGSVPQIEPPDDDLANSFSKLTFDPAPSVSLHDDHVEIVD